MKKIFLPIIPLCLLIGCGGDIEQRNEITTEIAIEHHSSNKNSIEIKPFVSDTELLNEPSYLMTNELIIRETQSTYENNLSSYIGQVSDNKASNPLIDINAELYRLEKLKN